MKEKATYVIVNIKKEKKYNSCYRQVIKIFLPASPKFEIGSRN
jgi:hypothetical protein